MSKKASQSHIEAGSSHRVKQLKEGTAFGFRGKCDSSREELGIHTQKAKEVRITRHHIVTLQKTNALL